MTLDVGVFYHDFAQGQLFSCVLRACTIVGLSLSAFCYG